MVDVLYSQYGLVCSAVLAVNIKQAIRSRCRL